VNDLAIMIALIVAGIFATNKIAGPAYRMQADIERALAGESGVRVHLRSGDAFPDLAEKVNKLLESIDDARRS
jgi:methyl-accepting chemotaxis protein